jgi:hypothetical protein
MANNRYAGVNSDDSDNEDLLTYERETDKEIISELRGEIFECQVNLEECKESKFTNKLKKLVSCGGAGFKPKKSRRKKNTKKKTKRVKKTKLRRKRQRTKKR